MLQWPLREALEAYMERRRDLDQAEFRHQEILWTITAPYLAEKDRGTRPSIPESLKDRYGDA